MITQTAKYVLKALVYMQQQEEEIGFFTKQDIARQVKVPTNYLGKIMIKLVQARILESQIGSRGGFRIARAAGNITIYDIFVAIDVIPADFGGATPLENDKLLSGFYSQLSALNQLYADNLKKITLADMSSSRNTFPFVSEVEITRNARMLNNTLRKPRVIFNA